MPRKNMIKVISAKLKTNSNRFLKISNIRI